MRLIDADALERVLDMTPCTDIKNIDGQAYVLVRLSQVFNIVKDAPTIDERKTGKWVYDTCSKCGKDLWDYFHFTEDGRIIEEPNFCPNCGADMRGNKDG